MDLTTVPVWVVDDDDVRYSIQFALATLGMQCSTFGSGEAFLEEVDINRPGCLVIDTHMKGMTGLEVFEHLRKNDSPIKVIFFSGRGSITEAVQAMEDGAVSFMQKPIYPDELVKKIHIARTRSILSEEMCAARRCLMTLSKRELQIFPLICDGLTSQEIAEKLYLSRRTVEVHRLHIARKLDRKNPVTILHDLCKDRLPGELQPPELEEVPE